MTTIAAPMCMECKHFRGEDPPTCDAYPDGIPKAIWTGGVDHTKPWIGDHGIRFELKPGTPALHRRVLARIYGHPF